MKKTRTKIIVFGAALVALFTALTVGNLLAAAAPPEAAPASSDAPDEGPSDAASPAPTSSGQTGEQPAPEGTSETLIVYFSYEGATEQLAEIVTEASGADVYEIVPEVPYPSRDETLDQAQAELDDGTFPEIAGDPPTLDDYDTVLIGYPIWWGEQPMIVQTFMRDNDLGDARVSPFVTHGGSRFGNSLDVLEEYYPDAEILEGYAVRGTDVESNPEQIRTDVDSWLSDLGL